VKEERHLSHGPDRQPWEEPKEALQPIVGHLHGTDMAQV
jgi:hypothetical protein